MKCAWVLSCFRLFAAPQTVARQTPLSMGFSRQEYWSRFPFPSPGNLPKPGTEAVSPVVPALQVDSLPLEPSGKPEAKTIGKKNLEAEASRRFQSEIGMWEGRVKAGASQEGTGTSMVRLVVWARGGRCQERQKLQGFLGSWQVH